MNKDQVKGRIEKAVGTLKEAAGMIAGDGSLEQKGRIAKTLGSVRARYGDRRDAVKKR
jgi:uncharacterized protein YjbJ (UPF0337 family)